MFEFRTQIKNLKHLLQFSKKLWHVFSYEIKEMLKVNIVMIFYPI
jgi:hypothetical protein